MPRAAGFAALFGAQLLAAFVDNLARAAIAWWIVGRAVSLGPWGAAAATIAATGAFVLPFAVGSGVAGRLADAWDRATVLRLGRALGLGAVVVWAWGLSLDSLALMLAGSVLAGVAATVFGPAKYAIVPDLVGEERVLAGSALLEGSTDLAILAGTLGGLAVGSPTGDAVVAATGLGAGVLSLGLTFTIPRSGAPALPMTWNFVEATGDALAEARRHVAVWRSILGLAWFWLVGQVLVGSFPAFATRVLGADDAVAAWLLGAFAAGIAAGSWVCWRLSRRQLELGVVPMGAFGMTVFLLDLAFAGGQVAGGTLPAFLGSVAGWRITVDLVGVAGSAAFLAVPLRALMLLRTADGARGRVNGAYNLVAGGAMLGGAVGVAALSRLGLPLPVLYGVLAVAGAAVAWRMLATIPEFMLRFWAFLLSNVVYRVSIQGDEHIPREGAAVLVCNHVSFIDWLIIMGAVRRPARFVMYKGFHGMPVIKYLFRHAKTIPIASAKEDPDALDKAMGTISDELRDGQIVVIFPEGKLTGDGEMAQFRPGIERILARDPVPVIPMALNGLWGGFFTRFEGKAFKRPFRRVWSKVWLTVEAPMPPTTTAAELEAKVAEIRGRRGAL